MKKPVIYAHRGASAYAPENTGAAFRKALDMKAGGIELDVHLSGMGMWWFAMMNGWTGSATAQAWLRT